MKKGYARVSTRDQNLDLQIDALTKAGCEPGNIYKEKVSGATIERPELNRLLESLREDDVLVVWKLDRLGRSLADLVKLVNIIASKKVALEVIEDRIDTTTPQGRLFFHIFAAVAEFQRGLILENTQAGLASARARGRVGGRPAGLSKEATIKMNAAKTLYAQQTPVKDICSTLSISKKTLYKYIKIGL